MTIQTNIMKVLKAKTAKSGKFTRVKNASGKLIDGLYVNHVKDFDYLVFDFSTKKIDTKFSQKYNAFEHGIGSRGVVGELQDAPTVWTILSITSRGIKYVGADTEGLSIQ